MKHPIGQTSNGITVYVDLIHSKAAKRIAMQPQLLTLVAEVVKQLKPKGAAIGIEHDMGRSIGYNFVLPTSESDTVFYAKLLKDDAFTRFIKNGKPLTTQYLTLFLQKNEDDATYELQDVWIGRLSPPRPGSTDETAESKPFWSTHAFILDSQPIQLQTVTKVCPY